MLAAAGVASRRGGEALIEAGPRARRRRVAQARRPRRPGDRAHRGRRRADRARGRRSSTSRSTSRPGVTSTVRDPHADRDRHRPAPAAPCAARASTRSAGSTATPRACCCSRTTAPGRRPCSIRATGSSASTPSGLGTRSLRRRRGGRAPHRASTLEEGIARVLHLRPATDVETRRLIDAASSRGRPGLDVVPGHARPGLEAADPADVRRGRDPVVRLVRVRIGPVRLDDLRSGRVRAAQRARGAGARADPRRPAADAPPAPRYPRPR